MNSKLIAFDLTYGLGKYTYKYYKDNQKRCKKELFVFEKNSPSKNANYVSLFVGLVIKDV